jgi:carboxypeptidase C (cathepsin A)
MKLMLFKFIATLLIVSPLLNAADNDPVAKPLPETIVVPSNKMTEHSVEIGGKQVPYTATAGMLPFKNEKGETKASFFYVAYTRNDIEDRNKRPISFCFNGGPGASAVWLQMGLLGPKRVQVKSENPTAPPYSYIDNPYSLLDVTDLVFIDPISTGYSRATNPENAKIFHSVEEDIKSVAEFIRLYTTINSRWESPKLLFGESYGTTRAALMVEYLHQHSYMHLNGIVLVSSVLDHQTIDRSDRQNETTYLVSLPSFAAAAWYHKKLSPELQEKGLKAVFAEAKAFAMNEYALAMLKGSKLTDAERQQIGEKVASFTGLSKNYVDRMNLRISLFPFLKELLRSEQRLIGRFDCRDVGIDLDPCDESFEFDPSLDTPLGLFTAVYNQYLRAELKWESDEEYRVITDVSPWDYGKATNQYLNVSSSLHNAMSRNPALKVFVANGFYDLATYVTATEYTFDHMFLDPKIKSNVTMGYYEGGHMMFLDIPSLKELSTDLHNFIEKTIVH